MRNVTGPPVEDDDFFDRPHELQKLQRELANGANILFTAPRRVGKTSLILRLCEVCRRDGWSAAFLNVEGCSDELTFAEKLVDELHRAGLNPEAMNRAATALRKVRQALGGVKVGIGVDIEIANAEDADYSTLARSLESIFRKIDEDGKKVLIAVDEMPELLLNLAKQENGTERVAQLLHWLRALRQTHRKHIHWIFLGSIGLDSFVDDRNLRKSINDLTTISIEALSESEAEAFLERLGRDNGLPIPAEVGQSIIHSVGWPLPHHLQIVFHALRDLGVETIDDSAVNQAFDFLIRPENLSQFDTWRQRLAEQFGANDASAARGILRHICQYPDGRTRAQILNDLMTTRPHADAAVVEEQLARLLQILQRDGYLLQRERAYAFRSFLLRQYWYQREVL
jgi:hypothetical protein